MAARDILVKFREKTKQRNMFLMFTDRENGAVVYVVDGDEDEWAYSIPEHAGAQCADDPDLTEPWQARRPRHRDRRKRKDA